MDSSTRDRIEGGFDSAKGHVESAVGEATGDERLRAEGALDQLAGDAKEALADAKDAAADLKDRAGAALDDLLNR